MLLFPVDKIAAISYSSITRLTFNLNIKLTEPIEGIQDYEFSMIDHNDYDEINDYVVRNSLENQSMSEARRAKQATNKPEFSNELEKVIAEDNGAGDDDEDEEQDEDYESGSDSEEAASESESDDDDQDNDEDDSDEEEEEEEEDDDEGGQESGQEQDDAE
ncbi:Rtt106p [Sugiyamaella lignohabitans]|uniref:Histone chaperone RTT106 n=1 Tax=Sugiyamaella lignohabitans TaxID=796027 RepID=A0A167ERD7_9ASCO|nr:Rtt106p [Sugiyamaella lignohabitans]ANB14384.1 Rtt106p [Sugiyamaella lignohabitans]